MRTARVDHRRGGNGHGDYPTTTSSSSGRRSSCRTVDPSSTTSPALIEREDGTFVRNAAQETGFLRPSRPHDRVRDGALTGSWRSGTADPPGPCGSDGHRHRCPTATAKAYAAGKRLYGYVDGDLLYAYDRPGRASRTRARLQRAAVGSHAQGRDESPHEGARLSLRSSDSRLEGPRNERPAQPAARQRLPAHPAAPIARSTGSARPGEVLAEVTRSSAINASTVCTSRCSRTSACTTPTSDRALTYHSFPTRHFLVCRNCQRVVSVGPKRQPWPTCARRTASSRTSAPPSSASTWRASRSNRGGRVEQPAPPAPRRRVR